MLCQLLAKSLIARSSLSEGLGLCQTHILSWHRNAFALTLGAILMRGFFFCCCFVLKDASPPATEFPRAFPVVSSPNTACTARHCLSVPFTYPHTSSLRGSRFPLSFYSTGTRRALSAPGVFQHKQLPPPVPTVETAEISRFSTSGT